MPHRYAYLSWKRNQSNVWSLCCVVRKYCRMTHGLTAVDQLIKNLETARQNETFYREYCTKLSTVSFLYCKTLQGRLSLLLCMLYAIYKNQFGTFSSPPLSSLSISAIGIGRQFSSIQLHLYLSPLSSYPILLHLLYSVTIQLSAPKVLWWIMKVPTAPSDYNNFSELLLSFAEVESIGITSDFCYPAGKNTAYAPLPARCCAKFYICCFLLNFNVLCLHAFYVIWRWLVAVFIM